MQLTGVSQDEYRGYRMLTASRMSTAVCQTEHRISNAVCQTKHRISNAVCQTEAQNF